MTKVSFRKSILDNLPVKKKRYFVADEKTNGLFLAVYPSGSRSYVIYRRINGVPQRIKIGNYGDLTIEAARKETIRLNATIALGSNPIEERKVKKQELNFHELFNLYYYQYALRFVKNPVEDEKMLERHFFIPFGKSKLGDITADKIRKLHLSIGEKFPGIANRTIAMASAVFNFGIKNGYFEKKNPCLGIVKFKSVSRDRFLTNVELELFFSALESEEEKYQDYFLILLFTGVRKSNLLSMQWIDIDLNLKRWRILEDKTKNRDVNIVYFPAPVLDILLRRDINNKKLKNPSKYVFPGTGKEGHFKDPKKAFHRIRKRMGVHDFTIHDLRRTLGSYMAISGASLPIIGKDINHNSQESTKIYARLSDDPVHNAIEKAVSLMAGDDVAGTFSINADIMCKKNKNTSGVRFNDLL